MLLILLLLIIIVDEFIYTYLPNYIRELFSISVDNKRLSEFDKIAKGLSKINIFINIYLKEYVNTKFKRENVDKIKGLNDTDR